MSDLLQELEKEVNSLETKFQNSLAAVGNNTLSQDYSDIITIRQSLKVLRRKAETESVVPAKESSENHSDNRMRNVALKAAKAQRPKASGFVLSKAVKEVAKSFAGNELFSIEEVWDKLKELYPNNIKNDGRKRSASATLSNLTKAGELVRVKKGIGGEQTVYKIAPAQIEHNADVQQTSFA